MQLATSKRVPVSIDLREPTKRRMRFVGEEEQRND